MREAPKHLLPLIGRVRAASVEAPPPPWRSGIAHSVGGLLALALSTHDGWTLERLALDWPADSVLLTPPGSWIYETRAGRSSAFTKLAEESEIRACGFSPTGSSLVLATTSGITIFPRTPTIRASQPGGSPTGR